MSMVDKLTYLKRKNKLTTEDIAARCNIPVGTLNKIFAGQTRSPSLPAMHGLCRVFNVPFCFLMEDEVPDDCSQMAYAESRGMFLMTEAELELFNQYRSLNERDRSCIVDIVGQYVERRPTPSQVENERLLPCYAPIAVGFRGLYTDVWDVKTVRATLDRISRDADFALVVFSDELAPFYQEGDVLAVKRRNCIHGQLGVFLLNGELFIRRVNRRGGVVKLSSLKSGSPIITIAPEDDMRCLGLVTGMLKVCEEL